MQVKIIRPKSGVWYETHVGEIIDVEISNDNSLFLINETFRVTGPQELLDYYYYECGWKHLGIDMCDVKDIRKEKLKRIIEED